MRILILFTMSMVCLAVLVCMLIAGNTVHSYQTTDSQNKEKKSEEPILHTSETIVVTTSLIETMVTNICGAKVEVVTLIPAGICPGHFDMTPQQARLIHASSLVFYHGWESWIADMFKKDSASNIQFIPLERKGNLMVPVHYLDALPIIVEQVSVLDPSNAEWYRENARIYSQKIMKETGLLM